MIESISDEQIQKALSSRTYGIIAAQVDIAMRIYDKPCIGKPCDEDFECTRHDKIVDIVDRYQRRQS